MDTSQNTNLFYNSYGMELRINNATWSDAGVYECTGSNYDYDTNQKYSESASITIHIEGDADINLKFCDFYAQEVGEGG